MIILAPVVVGLVAGLAAAFIAYALYTDILALIATCATKMAVEQEMSENEGFHLAATAASYLPSFISDRLSATAGHEMGAQCGRDVKDKLDEVRGLFV